MATAAGPAILPVPAGLAAAGSASGDFLPVGALAELEPGTMHRVTFGDLDVLVAHTSAGIVAVDDRCPHMSAPLSLGELDGCIVACPLHEGRFDLVSGDVVQMPTTGGLDADGTYHPTWTPGAREAKPDVPGRKAEARRFTRVRRLRYYRVRVSEGIVEVAIPR